MSQLSSINHIMVFRLAYTFFATLFITFVSLIIYLVYPFNPIDFKDVRLHKTSVKAGGIVEFTADFEKHADKTGTMTRILVCEKQSQLVLSTSLADAMCSDKSKDIAIEIPRTTRPGKCKIRWVVAYDYGIRGVTKGSETPTFEVVR